MQKKNLIFLVKNYLKTTHNLPKSIFCTIMKKWGPWGLFQNKNMIFFLISLVFILFFNITFQIKLDSKVALSCSTHTTQGGLEIKLMFTVTSPWGWPWKTTQKLPLTLWNASIGSDVMEMSFSMSANDYSDLTNGLALKNYPKMTFRLPKTGL